VACRSQLIGLLDPRPERAVELGAADVFRVDLAIDRARRVGILDTQYLACPRP